MASLVFIFAYLAVGPNVMAAPINFTDTGRSNYFLSVSGHSSESSSSAAALDSSAQDGDVAYKITPEKIGLDGNDRVVTKYHGFERHDKGTSNGTPGNAEMAKTKDAREKKARKPDPEYAFYDKEAVIKMTIVAVTLFTVPILIGLLIVGTSCIREKCQTCWNGIMDTDFLIYITGCGDLFPRSR